MNIREELEKYISPVTDYMIEQVESKRGDGEEIESLKAGIFNDGFFSRPVVWINSRRYVLQKK